MKRLLGVAITIMTIFGLFLVIAPAAYALAVTVPEIWYSINPEAIIQNEELLAGDPIDTTVALPQNSGFIDQISNNQLIDTLPPVNPNLAPGRRVMIPSIGVNTEIHEGDEQAALNKGVWLMPQHGNPVQNEQPVVLAAHRWGRLSWSRSYKIQHLFYNLPKVNIGDEIIVQWDQREFRYKINHKEQTQHVTRLDDVILVTCQYVNSPERIIVYASRVY